MRRPPSSTRGLRDEAYIRLADVQTPFLLFAVRLSHCPGLNKSYILCRIGFTSLPKLPVNELAKQYQFNLGIRRGYIRHLFLGSSSEISKVAQPNVSECEKVILLNAQNLHGKYFIKTICSALGREVGMSGADHVLSSTDYYALPNQTFSMAEALLRKMEVQRYEVGLEIMSPIRISSFSKRALREAESTEKANRAAQLITEIKLKKIADDDVKVRSSFNELQETYVHRLIEGYNAEIVNLNGKLSDSTVKLAESQSDLVRIKEGNDTAVDKHNREILLIYSSGLQRTTILTDVWHESNPTMCSHLFGFLSFQEYKVYCQCLFPALKLQYGKMQSDTITDWEKCTMVKLRMRRGTTYEIIGAIWSRNR